MNKQIDNPIYLMRYLAGNSGQNKSSVSKALPVEVFVQCKLTSNSSVSNIHVGIVVQFQKYFFNDLLFIFQTIYNAVLICEMCESAKSNSEFLEELASCDNNKLYEVGIYLCTYKHFK